MPMRSSLWRASASAAPLPLPRPPAPGAGPEPRLTLLWSDSEVRYGWGVRATRLRVAASSPVNCDRAVFLYQSLPPPPGSEACPAALYDVCRSGDYADLPAGQPESPVPNGRFRLDWFEIDIDSRVKAAAYLRYVHAAVGRLLRDQVALAQLSDPQPILVTPASDPYYAWA